MIGSRGTPSAAKLDAVHPDGALLEIACGRRRCRSRSRWRLSRARGIPGPRRSASACRSRSARERSTPGARRTPGDARRSPRLTGCARPRPGHLPRIDPTRREQAREPACLRSTGTRARCPGRADRPRRRPRPRTGARSRSSRASAGSSRSRPASPPQVTRTDGDTMRPGGSQRAARARSSITRTTASTSAGAFHSHLSAPPWEVPRNNAPMLAAGPSSSTAQTPLPGASGAGAPRQSTKSM